MRSIMVRALKHSNHYFTFIDQFVFSKS